MARTILLADDSVTIRKVVELTFGDTDIRVEAVGSGGEAMDRLEALRPDLVLADVVMPGPTGYELCRAIKSSNRPIPVLLLAGNFEAFDEQRAVDCGADGHLVKPFESHALLERVTALLAPSAGERPAAAAEVEQVLDDLTVSEQPAETPAAAGAGQPTLSAEQLDAIARRVLERLSDGAVREIAWEVVPELAETIIRERIRQLEQDAEED